MTAAALVVLGTVVEVLAVVVDAFETVVDVFGLVVVEAVAPDARIEVVVTEVDDTVAGTMVVAAVRAVVVVTFGLFVALEPQPIITRDTPINMVARRAVGFDRFTRFAADILGSPYKGRFW